MTLEAAELTRVMYQAHMEQQIRMSTTEDTVIKAVYPKETRKPLAPMAFA